MLKQWLAFIVTFTCFVLAVFIGEFGVAGLGAEHAVALVLIDIAVGFLAFRYFRGRGR